MKSTWIILAAVAMLMSGAALATQQDTRTVDPASGTDPAAPPPIPPIPPKVPNEEPMPTVVITEREGERIEEYSQQGRVYLVKITPLKGPAYYYVDADGDGQLELRGSDRNLNPVRPVYWKLKEW